MTKIVLAVLCVMFVQPLVPDDPLTYDPKKPLGDVSPIHISVSQFEERYRKDVLIPHYIPFTPTHSGGRCNERFQNVEIDFINVKTNEKLFIDVSFKNHWGKFVKQAALVTLDDGTKAWYLNDKRRVADFLGFHKDELFYEIGILKNHKNERLHDLIKVANSLK